MNEVHQIEPGKVSRKRTAFEALAWVVLIGFLWTVDTIGKISYRDTTGIGKDNLRLIIDQVTSATAVLVMILFTVYWLRTFPLRKNLWISAIIGHTFGSMIFAIGHHVLAVVQRIFIFSFYGHEYQWLGGFFFNLKVEYQKDIKIYLGVIAIISAYHYYRRTQNGPVSVSSPSSVTGDRLVAQTGSGEAILDYDEIDFIEAARNYVAVHAGGKEYLIRDTFANIEQKLAGGLFARCHRSYMVNLSKVAEIRTVDGARQVLLKNGAALPLGRSYRDEFRSSIAPD